MTKKDVMQWEAQIVQVKTTMDGGIHITLSIPPVLTDTVKTLMDCWRIGSLLGIAAVVLKNNKDQHAIPERQKRKSKWTTAKK